MRSTTGRIRRTKHDWTWHNDLQSTFGEIELKTIFDRSIANLW